MSTDAAASATAAHTATAASDSDYPGPPEDETIHRQKKSRRTSSDDINEDPDIGLQDDEESDNLSDEDDEYLDDEYLSDNEEEDDFNPDEFDLNNEDVESDVYDPFSMSDRQDVKHVPEEHPFDSDLQFGNTNTRSAAENVVLNKIRQLLKEDVSRPLIEKNQVYIPLSLYEQENKINLTRREIRKLGKKRGVYFVFSNGKIGRSVDLHRRSTEYDDIAGIIIMVFDYDYAEPECINDVVTAVIKKITNMRGVKLNDVENLDYEKINELEENGLSIFPRLLFHLITNNKAGDIQSILNGVNLNNIELALTEGFRDDYGISVNESSAMAEHLICRLMKWVIDARSDTTSMAQQFFSVLTKNEFDLIVKKRNIVEAILSWRRGEPKAGKERSIDAMKVMAFKVILGVSGQENSDDFWCDTVDDTPGDGAQMFDKSNYEPAQLKKGVAKLIGLIKTIEDDGGVRALDVNELIMKHLKTDMVTWLEERGWEPFFSALDMVVFRYRTDDGKPRMLFVNRPACWTFFSGQNVSGYSTGNPTPRQMNNNDAISQARRGKTGELLQTIFQVITSEHEDTTTIDSLQLKPCTTLHGNILMAFAFRMYILKNIHGSRFAATLVAKYLLMMEHCNVFEEDCHGLAASKHGINLKAQGKSIRGETSYTMDRQIRDKLLCNLTHLRINNTEDEIDQVYDDLIKLLDDSSFDEDGDDEVSKEEDDDVYKRKLSNQQEILDRFLEYQLTSGGKDIHEKLIEKLTIRTQDGLQHLVDEAVAAASTGGEDGNNNYAPPQGFVGFGAPPE